MYNKILTIKRNEPFSAGIEPDHALPEPSWPSEWDSHLETLLVQDYTYNNSGGDSLDNVVVGAAGNSTAAGSPLHFADLYVGPVPPTQTYGTRGTHPYDGISNGPSDGFYWTI